MNAAAGMNEAATAYREALARLTKLRAAQLEMDGQGPESQAGQGATLADRVAMREAITVADRALGTARRDVLNAAWADGTLTHAHPLDEAVERLFEDARGGRARGDLQTGA
ncbi:MAG: hypothetical protein EPN34_06140 [Burkholderiaceae bacterium]|nr:MAG: hypothetical protein EPN34_06140 [Burkholderiaceae bacterium]